MKSTGIVRKIDELGRIVVPKELRTTLGIRRWRPNRFEKVFTIRSMRGNW